MKPVVESLRGDETKLSIRVEEIFVTKENPGHTVPVKGSPSNRGVLRIVDGIRVGIHISGVEGTRGG